MPALPSLNTTVWSWKRFKQVKQWARLLVSIALLTLALTLFDWDLLFGAMHKVKLLSFSIAIVLNVLVHVTLGLRWYWLMRETGIASVRERQYQYFAATFANSFTPAGLGGDVFRALSTGTAGQTASIVAVLLRERLLGFSMYLLTVVGAFLFLKACYPALYLPWGGPLGLASLAAATILAGVISAPALLSWLIALFLRWHWPARFMRILGFLRTALHFPTIRTFVLTSGLTILGIFLWVVSIVVLAREIAPDIPWPVLALAAAAIEIIRFLPISIQGIGIREGGFSLLIASLGYSSESGFVIAAIAYAALSLTMLAAGPIASILRLINMRTQRSPR